MRAAMKRLLGRLCLAPGAGRLLNPGGPGRFVVLMFHRVVGSATLETSAGKPLMVEDGIFAQFAETLAGTCRCLPLDQIRRLSAEEADDARPVVAITFDDGYADFHDTAFPILRRYGLPATMFLSVGFLDRPGRFFWWDAVEAFFASPRAPEALMAADLPRDFLRSFRAVRLDPAPAKVAAFIRGPVLALGASGRERFLGLLPPAKTPPPAMLTWEQVRSLADSGLVDFGAHCVGHPLLDEMAFAPALEEVAASKRRIEEVTGRKVASFAYPGGRVPPYFRELLERAGIGLAVTTRFGTNGPASDPLLLRRVDARFCLAGDCFDPCCTLAVCSGRLDWLHGAKEV